MRRIESRLIPAETRLMLRERLGRFLPTHAAPTCQVEGAVRPLVSDIELLQFFSHLDFIPGDDISRARQVYEQAAQAQTARLLEAARPPADGADATVKEAMSAPELHQSMPVSVSVDSLEDAATSAPMVSVRVISPSPNLDSLSPPPPFDGLVNDGWIRASWGRVCIPRDIATVVLRSRRPDLGAFRQLIEQSGHDEFGLKNGFNPSETLRKIAVGIVSEEYRPGQIACVSRAWIAARLWDSTCDGVNGIDAHERIGQWVDRWRLLNHPRFAMSTQLDRASFEDFLTAAISALTTRSTTPGWGEFRDAVVAPTALLYPHQGSNLQTVAPNVPVTTVDRYRWMLQRGQEAAFHEYLDTRAASLMTVLLNELTNGAHDQLGLARRLIDVAIERPILFHLLVRTATSWPVLLADLLMAPSTCPLACSLIASWQFNTGGWNREFQAHANSATELFAFEDALATLGEHLDAGQVNANELAALYLYTHELASARKSASNRYTMLSLLREEIASAGTRIHDDVVTSLIESATANPEPMNPLFAALDLVSAGEYMDRIDPEPLVSLYLNAVLPKGERTGNVMGDTQTAQTLVALALKCNPSLRSQFLNAINVSAWIQEAAASSDNEYIYRDLIIRRVRLHLRIVSSAIARWPTEVPGELVESLARSVRAGAMERPDRGRIDAFGMGAGRSHSLSGEQAPIALDLAAALRKLNGSAARYIVVELCQIEEPVVLAGIVANTPPTSNEQIRARLLSLTPEASSEIWSFPALQARVQALLNAGLPDVAEIFLTAERSAKTLGVVPNRETLALREDLHLLLLREDWPRIASYALPESMSDQQRRESNEVLLFYQGLAELRKPNGSVETAESLFSGLALRNRGIATYHTNLFASRVHRLLATDAFQILAGESLREAKRYLAEARQITRPLVQHSPQDLMALDMNRAMLLLATNQPGESLQVLLLLRESNYDASIEGFRALAWARLGSKREALAALTQAELTFGRSSFLSAVRANIDTHWPYATAPSLSLDDDPVPGMRQAFEAFSRLGHAEQAEVLDPRGRLDLYVLDQIRGACASLVALAPMMRELGMVRYEDDISSVLKQILRSRLLFPQWTVEDQPRGGFSQSGGVGERDIVVSKGSATLAVIEALITEFVETGNLTSHFRKLFAYDTCRFFFHITYARRANCGRILDYLRSACTTPPEGITYIDSEPIPDLDSAPVGFKAYYDMGSRKIVVVFLALEIGQPLQRAAAETQ